MDVLLLYLSKYACMSLTSVSYYIKPFQRIWLDRIGRRIWHNLMHTRKNDFCSWAWSINLLEEQLSSIMDIGKNKLVYFYIVKTLLFGYNFCHNDTSILTYKLIVLSIVTLSIVTFRIKTISKKHSEECHSA